MNPKMLAELAQAVTDAEASHVNAKASEAAAKAALVNAIDALVLAAKEKAPVEVTPAAPVTA